MLITGREARRTLVEAGLTDRQARRVLAGGLAGPAVTTSGCHLFDEVEVRALARRPVLTEQDVGAACPGLFVVCRRGDATAAATWAEQAGQLRQGWHGVGRLSRMLLGAQIHDAGAVPFVATLAGFVYFGADLVGGAPDGSWLLREPGRWFEQVDGTRLPTPPGRPWHLGGVPWGVFLAS